MSLLEVRGVSVAYDTVPVVFGVDLEVGAGEVVALLGANGAGKTTVLRAISGLVPVQAGTVRFEGRDLHGVPEHERVRLGLAHVPEGRRVFPSLTVMENLRLGGHLFRRDRRKLAELVDRAFSFFPVLRERRDQPAGTLSGGEQQMLAIARGLMCEPRLLMVDEASLGLAPTMVEHVFEILRQIHDSGTSVFVVEQNARVSLEIADRAYVLEKGRVVFGGTARELARDRRLAETYLGGAVGARSAGGGARGSRSGRARSRR